MTIHNSTSYGSAPPIRIARIAGDDISATANTNDVLVTPAYTTVIGDELGYAVNGTISFNDTDVRRLAGKLTGSISAADFLGKSYYFVFDVVDVNAPTSYTVPAYSSTFPYTSYNYIMIGGGGAGGYISTASTLQFRGGGGAGSVLFGSGSLSTDGIRYGDVLTITAGAGGDGTTGASGSSTTLLVTRAGTNISNAIAAGGIGAGSSISGGAGGSGNAGGAGGTGTYYRGGGGGGATGAGSTGGSGGTGNGGAGARFSPTGVTYKTWGSPLLVPTPAGYYPIYYKHGVGGNLINPLSEFWNTSYGNGVVVGGGGGSATASLAAGIGVGGSISSVDGGGGFSTSTTNPNGENGHTAVKYGCGGGGAAKYNNTSTLVYGGGGAQGYFGIIFYY